MKRIRHVVKTREVAHLWAHKAQSDARNGTNFSFDGEEIKSYSTTIARHFVTVKGKKPCVIVDRRDYSNTTRRHKHLVRSALPTSILLFNVNDIRSGPCQEDIEYLERKAHNQIERALVCQGRNIKYCLDNVDNRILHEAELLADAFKLKRPFKTSKDANYKAAKEREARLESPSNPTFARRKQREEQRIARIAYVEKCTIEINNLIDQRIETYRVKENKPEINPIELWRNHQTIPSIVCDVSTDEIKAWMKERHLDPDATETTKRRGWGGARSYSTHPNQHTFKMFLVRAGLMEGRGRMDFGLSARLRFVEFPQLSYHPGKEVETSLGARVPFVHIQKVWPLVIRLLTQGKTYKANGHTIHLGHYKLDEIKEDGTIIAGCHTFTKEEVLAFGKFAGLPIEEQLETTIQEEPNVTSTTCGI